ncbi:MAG: hypothetical protein AAB879_02955 [Patescibacteria group bacterium]
MKRFLFHVSLAMTAWVSAAIVVETRIPGFVTPYADIPGIALLTCAMTILAILCPASHEIPPPSSH